jgi:hypothetical protein
MAVLRDFLRRQTVGDVQSRLEHEVDNWGMSIESHAPHSQANEIFDLTRILNCLFPREYALPRTTRLYFSIEFDLKTTRVVGMPALADSELFKLILGLPKKSR